ncbi:RNA-binding domain-containing protein [Macrococcoides canis]|nr:RNA-binding domain-containing protein [Macrococcus canis]
MHDIICLANTLENREAYLIIGVDDNGNLVGFKDDSFR